MKTPLLPTEFSGANWQLFGELELSVGAGAGSLIQTWLLDTLSPLHLSAGFLNKILASARLALETTLQAEAGNQIECIRLLVYTLQDHSSDGQSWGFCRIEKGLSSPAARQSHVAAIEFFLYQEG